MNDFDAQVEDYLKTTSVGEFATVAFPELRTWLDEGASLLRGGESEDPMLEVFVAGIREFLGADQANLLLAAIKQHVHEGGAS